MFKVGQVIKVKLKNGSLVGIIEKIDNDIYYVRVKNDVYKFYLGANTIEELDYDRKICYFKDGRPNKRTVTYVERCKKYALEFAKFGLEVKTDRYCKYFCIGEKWMEPREIQSYLKELKAATV